MKTFALEGRFPVPWIIGAGLAVVALLAVLAWKERRYATRPKWIWMSLALRLLVVALTFWALAGPTDVIEDKRTKPKGFGIFVDGSASMTIQDAGDGTGNVGRWTDAGRSDQDVPPQVLLDKALGALTAARVSLKPYSLAQSLTDESDIEELGERLLGSARGALDSCANYLSEFDASQSVLEQSEAVRFDELRLFVNEQLIPAVDKKNVSEGDDIAESLDRAEQSLRGIADAAYGRIEESLPAAGAADVRNRISLVTPWVEELEESWLAPQEKSLRIGRFAFDAEAIPTSAASWGKYLIDSPAKPEVGTSLGAAIEQAAREAAAGRMNAAVIITDGAHNTGRDPREAAGTLSGMPLVIVPIGDARLRRDLFLHHVQYAKSLIHKDVLSIDAMVTAHACEGEKVTVDLLADGKAIDSKTVTIRTPSEDHRLNLKWKATELGIREFQLRIVPVDGEFSEDNNTEILKVQVIDDEMRVFLADDLPRWEFRYLLTLFKRDPKVTSESALFSPQHVYPNRQDKPPVPRLPSTIEEWRRFRVVVLGDLTEQEFTPEQRKMVKQYLIEGGNLVVIAGETAMPQKYAGTEFGDLMPVDFRALSPSATSVGFTLEVAPDARDVPPVQLAATPGASAALWRTISESLPVFDLSPCSMPKPTANVLIEAIPAQRSNGERRAFLSWQYVGRGRVVFAAAPALHKLRYRHGDRYHYRFWGQMLRWIVARELIGGSKSVRLTTDKTRYSFGERVQATLRLTELDGQPVSDEEVSLVAESTNGVVSRIDLKPDKKVPGEYHAILVGLPTGAIKLVPEGARIDTLLRREEISDPVETEIAVDPHDSIELRNPLCDNVLLSAVADASGGVLLSPVAAREYLNHIDLKPEFEQRLEREPLWSKWWLLLATCALLMGDWICRKVIGLV
ncbi:MAG: hypothetical protein KDN22_33115 [Verrucomicrobiae bacterium]|nr:hypothetical protein [Verrucomicrobiae bacterium]